MVYLFLSILCSAAIFIIFKYFEKFNVNTFGAIVINYFMAACTGALSLNEPLNLAYIKTTPWFFNSILLGIVFISLFNIMALTAQKLGPSVASIANKMALIIPVVFAIYYYNDTVNTIKVIGILLALLGVFLSTHKEKTDGKKLKLSLLLMPLFLFLGSGFIDTFLKFNQDNYLNERVLDAKLFPALTFFTAFSIGLVYMIVNKKKRTLNKQTIIGGITLGVINYGSIYFLIQIFNHTNLESSVAFPINNMGVVLTTAITSILLFKEEMSAKNKIGILISLLALVLIVFSQ